MDASINAINVTTTSATKTETSDKQTEKMKELVKNNNFNRFDIDNDGKITGAELAKLKLVFGSINFDTDDDNAIDESAFNKALSNYQE